MDLKNSLVRYGVTLGMSYTKKQKQLFLDEVIKELDSRKIKYRIQEKRSAILSVRHLIIGDPSSAKKVIAAAYDTPAKAFWPGYQWYPFKLAKNRVSDRRNLAVETVIVILLMAAAVFLFSFVPAGVLYQKILFSAAGLILALLGYSFSKGRPNKVNFAMNSASVALLMDLLSEYGAEETAYILMDESATSLEGAKILKETVPSTTKILFLNGLAEGSKKMLVHGKKCGDMKAMAEDLDGFEERVLTEAQMNNCVLGVYPDSAMLIRGERFENDLVLCNAKTKNDIKIDTAGLQEIENGLQKWLIQ